MTLAERAGGRHDFSYHEYDGVGAMVSMGCQAELAEENLGGCASSLRFAKA